MAPHTLLYAGLGAASVIIYVLGRWTLLGKYTLTAELASIALKCPTFRRRPSVRAELEFGSSDAFINWNLGGIHNPRKLTSFACFTIGRRPKVNRACDEDDDDEDNRTPGHVPHPGYDNAYQKPAAPDLVASGRKYNDGLVSTSRRHALRRESNSLDALFDRAAETVDKMDKEEAERQFPWSSECAPESVPARALSICSVLRHITTLITVVLQN